MKKAGKLLKDIIEKFSAKTGINPKLLIVVSMLIAGVVFLAVSELKAEKKTSAEFKTETTAFSQNADEYAASLETRLTSIISSIEGAGATKVMVTLESGSEDIYLHDYDYGENIDPSGKNSLERKDEYVIIYGDSGEKGIVVRVAQPRVRGVAVVCEGGGSNTVREQIVNAVTALLDISSARVSVAKMN